MAELPTASANDYKPPKTPRRLKTPDPTRQVHFEGEGKNSNSTTNSNSKAEQQGTFGVHVTKTPEPAFPQVGPAPAGSTLQWHISANPTQSLNVPGLCQPHTPGGPYAHLPFHLAHPEPHLYPPTLFHPSNPSFLPPNTPGVTYIGLQHQPPTQVNMASDYQNAGPLPNGVHFQPPVPDTTFGPIPHVYVPRFDGGLVPGVQVGPPSVQFVSTPACATVFLPKTVYLNGYTYYASGPADVFALFLIPCWDRESSGSTPARSQLPSNLVPQLSFLSSHPSLASICANIYLQQPSVPQPSVQGGYVVAQQPYLVQQPVVGQPIVGQPVINQQPVMISSHPPVAPQPQMVPGVPAVGLAGGVAAMSGAIPILAGNSGHIPEVTGLGRTAGEEQLRQARFAHANRLHEPQEFKPADDDPSRYYYVREVDGTWTQRNRFTIDSMGDCRWYVTDEGWFYASRLPE